MSWTNWIIRGLAILIIAAGIKWIGVTPTVALLGYIVFEQAILQNAPTMVPGKSGYTRRQKIEMIAGLIVIIFLFFVCYIDQKVSGKINEGQAYPTIATPIGGD